MHMADVVLTAWARAVRIGHHGSSQGGSHQDTPGRTNAPSGEAEGGRVWKVSISPYLLPFTEDRNRRLRGDMQENAKTPQPEGQGASSESVEEMDSVRVLLCDVNEAVLALLTWSRTAT